VAKSLQQVLGYVEISGRIQATASGIPQPLPPAFLKPTRGVIGNKARYTRYTGERRVAKLNKYGAPARRTNLRDVGEVDVRLLHSFDEQPMDAATMKYLRSPVSYEFDQGEQEVARQDREFAMKQVNLRVAATLQVLRVGKIYWDADGNLLPSSSGAVETHDFQLAANNKDQLNGIIAQSWALTSTDIPLHLRNLKKRARRLTGLPLRYAIYGENIPTYLSQNDYVLDYLARNPDMNQRWLASAEIPDGLFGFTWVPAYEAFYEDDAGTNQDLWSGDAVVFTPEVDETWWEFLEGTFPVPTTLNVQADAEAAIKSFKDVRGMFGYATVGYNPPSITTYRGDTFLPTLKVPDAVFSADVTP
jgi:hypothetical protein